MNAWLAVLVCPSSSAATSTTPTTPTGVCIVAVWLSRTVMSLARLVPNRKTTPGAKPAPNTVTNVPPAIAPLDGTTACGDGPCRVSLVMQAEDGSGASIAITDPDVVVDATGSNKSMAHSLNYCAFKARLVYVGITQAEISLPHAPILHRRELDILASRNALSADFTRIIRLIEEGQIDTQPWITHRATFDELIDVFSSYTRPETGVIKAVVEVGA